MKVSLVERERNTIELGLIYGSIVLFILASVYFVTTYTNLYQFFSSHHVCIFKRITYLPCPTCGGTRATIHLAHLNLPDAFLINPMVATGIIVILLWALYSLLGFITKSKRMTFALGKNERKVFVYSIIGLVVINWLYLILVSKP